MNITIYSKSNCPNCETAKSNLKKLGLPFAEVDAEKPGTVEALIAMWPEARQMPQIFIDGQRIGGLAGLKKYLIDKGLLHVPTTAAS
jgi:glutaredoxin 3